MTDSILTASEARAALPDILDRVLAGEEITITRHGHRVAVVVHPDALRVRRARTALATANEVGDLIARGRDEPLPPRGIISQDRAEELVAEVRASRSR